MAYYTALYCNCLSFDSQRKFLFTNSSWRPTSWLMKTYHETKYNKAILLVVGWGGGVALQDTTLGGGRGAICYLLHATCYELSDISCLQPPTCYLRSAILYAICWQLSTICYQLSAVLSTICYLLSTICYLLPAICHLLSTICYLVYSILYLLFIFILYLFSAFCYLQSTKCHLLHTVYAEIKIYLHHGHYQYTFMWENYQWKFFLILN